jgi:hypothetical protein
MDTGNHSYSLRGYGEPDRSWVELSEVTVDLCEPAAITWSIVNSGNSDNTRRVASILTKAVEDATNDFIKDLITGGNSATLSGSLAGAVAAYLLDSLLSYIFTDCDGIVAVGSLTYPMGWQLQKAVLESPQHRLTRSVRDVGNDAPGDCNVSDYTVTWYIAWN